MFVAITACRCRLVSLKPATARFDQIQPITLDLPSPRRQPWHVSNNPSLGVARSGTGAGSCKAWQTIRQSAGSLGGGWVAEEALAIAICASVAAEDFSDGIVMAVNHSGDSDSSAAITGNVLGALWGEGAIATSLDRGARAFLGDRDDRG
jgi:ADP-ribosylglycohydrolase